MNIDWKKINAARVSGIKAFLLAFSAKELGLTLPDGEPAQKTPYSVVKATELEIGSEWLSEKQHQEAVQNGFIWCNSLDKLGVPYITICEDGTGPLAKELVKLISRDLSSGNSLMTGVKVTCKSRTYDGYDDHNSAVTYHVADFRPAPQDTFLVLVPVDVIDWEK